MAVDFLDRSDFETIRIAVLQRASTERDLLDQMMARHSESERETSLSLLIALPLIVNLSQLCATVGGHRSLAASWPIEEIQALLETVLDQMRQYNLSRVPRHAPMFLLAFMGGWNRGKDWDAGAAGWHGRPPGVREEFVERFDRSIEDLFLWMSGDPDKEPAREGSQPSASESPDREILHRHAPPQGRIPGFTQSGRSDEIASQLADLFLATGSGKRCACGKSLCAANHHLRGWNPTDSRADHRDLSIHLRLAAIGSSSLTNLDSGFGSVPSSMAAGWLASQGTELFYTKYRLYWTCPRCQEKNDIYGDTAAPGNQGFVARKCRHCTKEQFDQSRDEAKARPGLLANDTTVSAASSSTFQSFQERSVFRCLGLTSEKIRCGNHYDICLSGCPFCGTPRPTVVCADGHLGPSANARKCHCGNVFPPKGESRIFCTGAGCGCMYDRELSACPACGVSRNQALTKCGGSPAKPKCEHIYRLGLGSCPVCGGQSRGSISTDAVSAYLLDLRPRPDRVVQRPGGQYEDPKNQAWAINAAAEIADCFPEAATLLLTVATAIFSLPLARGSIDPGMGEDRPRWQMLLARRLPAASQAIWHEVLEYLRREFPADWPGLPGDETAMRDWWGAFEPQIREKYTRAWDDSFEISHRGFDEYLLCSYLLSAPSANWSRTGLRLFEWALSSLFSSRRGPAEYVHLLDRKQAPGLTDAFWERACERLENSLRTGPGTLEAGAVRRDWLQLLEELGPKLSAACSELLGQSLVRLLL